MPQPEHASTPGNWNLVWGLDVPPKVKNFLWWCCRNVLPTQDRLATRGVQCPAGCLRCTTGDESTMHLFTLCPFSKGVWVKEDLWSAISMCLTRHNTFSELFFELSACLTKPQFINFAMVLWSLWFGRNMLLWEGIEENVASVVTRARVAWDDWKRAALIHSPSQARGGHNGTCCEVWQRPPSGYLACNVDAAFPSDRLATGISICLRGEAGDFLMARTEWQAQRLDVKEGEAWGLLQALLWAQELELSHVVFQLDSKLVVDNIMSSNRDISEFGCLISQCRDILSFFPNFKVEFIRRQANVAAHSMARAATSWASPHVFESVPMFIGDIIDLEMQ